MRLQCGQVLNCLFTQGIASFATLKDFFFGLGFTLPPALPRRLARGCYGRAVSCALRMVRWSVIVWDIVYFCTATIRAAVELDFTDWLSALVIFL